MLELCKGFLLCRPLLELFVMARFWTTKVFKKQYSILICSFFFLMSRFQDLVVCRSLKIVVWQGRLAHRFNTASPSLTHKFNLEQWSPERVITGSLWFVALKKLPDDVFAICPVLLGAQRGLDRGCRSSTCMVSCNCSHWHWSLLLCGTERETEDKQYLVILISD